MIFIIIWSFSYWPRQNIRGIEGNISKKKFLRKKQYCSQESGQTVSGAKRIPLYAYYNMYMNQVGEKGRFGDKKSIS